MKDETYVISISFSYTSHTFQDNYASGRKRTTTIFMLCVHVPLVFIL
jgi:hypothetical protein